MVHRKKINLLFVLIQVDMGGTERIVLDLARKLDRSRFNVYLASFKKGVLERDFNDICEEVFYIPKKHGFDLSAILRVSKIIQERHIDVINAHHYMSFFYSYIGSKILHQRKLIYTEHSVPEIESILSTNHKKLINLMLYNTNYVVGVSKEISETLKNTFPRHSDRFKYILNGVDVNRFSITIDRDELRSTWGILPENFVIGAIANFRKVKNHACLIRASNLLSTAYPHVRLVLVGKGFPNDPENSEGEVRNLITINGLQERVIMPGYQEDIPSMLKTFDVFCLSSFSEGLPVSVLEAMAAKIPVVGSNVRGISEVISQGKTGILFPSNDENALAHALERLIKETTLRESISNSAYDYVCKEHGLQQWITAYIHLFSS